MARLTVSFGTSHPARITEERQLTWDEYVDELLATVPETDDKAARGWSIPAKFAPAYRDSDNFVERSALTFDYDVITPEQLDYLRKVFADRAHVEYATWSSTPERPRYRFIFPTDRPMNYDEFQAVSRMVASWAGIELTARESHTPAQMMYLPTCRPGSKLDMRVVEGKVLKVDDVLAQYLNWADPSEWPRYRKGDSVAPEGVSADPRQKPGIIGAFARAFPFDKAIERFDLPYKSNGTDDRYDYTAGSRGDGVIAYDEGTKVQSWNGTDPCYGQNSIWDVVRLHKLGSLDTDADLDRPISERPSQRAMMKLAADQPEVQRELGGNEFDDLGDMPVEPELDAEPVADEKGAPAMARRLDDVLAHPTTPRWLLKDVLEEKTIALLVGPRGSYKSFVALDWAMQVAVAGHDVYVVSAEGGDFDRRAQAWLLANFEPEISNLYVVERRLDLSAKEGVELIRQDCVKLGIRPKLFVLDTFSKLSGGLDENDNTEVKAFIGRIDNGLKRAFGAAVILVAHTGHSDSGRARGASALEADTEAAHIVSRNHASNTVSITRERFKSSPELPPLVFEPQVIDLGRKDGDGMPVTSLVLKPLTGEQGKEVQRQTEATKRMGRWQVPIWKALEKAGGTLGIEACMQEALAKWTVRDPEDPRPDRRREYLARGIESLIQEKRIYRHNGKLSFSPAAPFDDAELGDMFDNQKEPTDE
jgi:AAA domain